MGGLDSGHCMLGYYIKLNVELYYVKGMSSLSIF